MTIERIKKELLKYTDFYGGDIYDTEAIEKATTKQDLAAVIENHRTHLEHMLCDAGTHLDALKDRCGLRY